MVVQKVRFRSTLGYIEALTDRRSLLYFPRPALAFRARNSGS